MFSQSNLFVLVILSTMLVGAYSTEVGHGALPDMYPDGQFDAIATRLLLCCGALKFAFSDSYKFCQGAVYQAYKTDNEDEFHQQLWILEDRYGLPNSCFKVPAVHKVQTRQVSTHQQELTAQKKSEKEVQGH